MLRTVASAFRWTTAQRIVGPAKAGHYVLCAVLAATSIAHAAENTLLDAAERGDRAAVARLLTKGANPNTPGPDGATAVIAHKRQGPVKFIGFARPADRQARQGYWFSFGEFPDSHCHVP